MNLRQSGFNLAYFIQHQTPLWQEAFGAVMELIARGMVKIAQPMTFPLAQAAVAHHQLETRQTKGKVVLIP
jgi:NADPH2:quinone reductase